MAGEAVLDGVVAEPCPGSCREEWIAAVAGVFGEPLAQDTDGECGERCGACLAAFADAADVRPAFECDVPSG
jgi:hypothetical protein